MVSYQYIKRVVKKRYSVSSKDKKDWINFTKHIQNIEAKEVDALYKKNNVNNVRKLDLHGFSLAEANEVIKKFISESFHLGFKKLLVVTGKGLRSKSHNNPYYSEKLSTLRYSIPEYIKNNSYLTNKVSSISKAEPKDGGEGAIYIFLKNKKKL